MNLEQVREKLKGKWKVNSIKKHFDESCPLTKNEEKVEIEILPDVIYIGSKDNSLSYSLIEYNSKLADLDNYCDAFMKLDYTVFYKISFPSKKLRLIKTKIGSGRKEISITIFLDRID